MSRFHDDTKNVSAHDRLKLFFDIMTHLQTNDVPRYPDLDPTLKQIAFSERETISSLFRHVIDQPSYMTNDHKRMRKLIIDWYASHRSLATQAEQYSNPYNLSSDALDELIRSFGFPYSNRIADTDDKIAFLLELVNLYNKKGTPKTLATALEFFGLTNVRISEWWIKKGGGADYYFAQNKIVWPQNILDYEPIDIPYETFISGDPYWQLSKTQLMQAYNTSLITLPSLTPHISIDASVPFTDTYLAISVLAKEMQESWDLWATGGTLSDSLTIDKYGMNVSFLELALAIIYTFNYGKDPNDVFLGDRLYMYYGDTMDENNLVNYDINVIRSEFNSILKRPKTKAEQKSLMAEFQTKFTEEVGTFFIQKFGDVADAIDAINPDLLVALDEDLLTLDPEEILEPLFHELDRWIFSGALLNYYLSYVTIGTSMYERIKPIIEFFKPYRARIREFLTAFSIQDPLHDSIIPADTGIYNENNDPVVNELIYDYLYPHDEFSFLTKVEFESYVNEDSFDQTMHDAAMHVITEIIDDNLDLTDEFSAESLSMFFADGGNRAGDFDHGICTDRLVVRSLGGLVFEDNLSPADSTSMGLSDSAELGQINEVINNDSTGFHRCEVVLLDDEEFTVNLYFGDSVIKGGVLDAAALEDEIDIQINDL